MSRCRPEAPDALIGEQEGRRRARERSGGRQPARLLHVLTDGIARTQASGDVRADLDPAETARSLQALMDGLGLRVLSGNYTADEA